MGQLTQTLKFDSMMDLKGDGVDCGGVEHVGTKNRLVNVLMKVLSFS